MALLALPGLVACNVKGDPAAYLRRGLVSKEPASSASSPIAYAPLASSVTIGASPTTSASTPIAIPSPRSDGKPNSYAAALPPSAGPRNPALPASAEPSSPQTTQAVAVAPAASTVPSAQPVAAPSSSPSVSPPIGGKRNVSIGGAAVSGGNVSNAARVVAGLRAPLRACYSAATSSGPGSLRFTISIGKTGAVSSANAQRSGELSSDLVACALGVVKSAKFDPPEHGAATLLVPATFIVQ
jgi:hypothetical protein